MHEISGVQHSSRLRPYQAKIKQEAREKHAQGVRRILIQLVTGGGKTNLAEEILRDAESRGSVAWFAAHRDNLISQAARHFGPQGSRSGFIKAGQRPRSRWPLSALSARATRRSGRRI
ncbi:DEAD/DEAH box helicase family protein [Limimaricola variabilis]|uniref:DEAD/DEAH box helicase family protein n=1 Tax=Limimaricola variabilis TaxID=1492771 RepID=UPI00160B6E2A